MTKESALEKMTDFNNYWKLSDDEEKLLIALCTVLDPSDLDGGCSQ